MKTTTTMLFVFCFSVFGLFAQSIHEEMDDLFESNSLFTFENDLGLQPGDYDNQSLIDYIDAQYQSFFSGYYTRVENGETITSAEFHSDYQNLVNSNLITINSMKGGGNPPITTKIVDGPCVNMDFESGDLTGWDLTRGNVDGSAPFSFVGEFAVGPGPYHTVFGGGVDPVTGIPRVNPLGGAFSTRLGNGTGTGARAARMKQTFMVDATNYMFTYSYAVIFQSPVGHSLDELPYFTVRVIDSAGVDVPCGEYSVIADAANAADYETTNWGGSTVLYKNWETVFANLDAYIGQNVTVIFTAGDCSLSGHFGYAYVDASCGVDEITASQDIICTGDSSILTAPLGASSYLWNTGATTQEITVFAGGTYSCTLTPSQGGGCSIDLDITIGENPSPTAEFNSNTVVACLSDSVHFNDLSTIPLPGVITDYRWDFGDGIVTPLSNGIIGAVPGTTGDYTAPSHIYAAPGVYNVELYVLSADGCSDSITYSVTINAIPIVVAGADQTVCEGSAVILTGAGANVYAWDNGVTNGVPFVQAPGVITYTVTGTDLNGCVNTDQVDVIVNANPIIDAGVDQIVCIGSMVTLNGAGATAYVWDNGVMDGVAFAPGVGTLTYIVTGTDLNGCVNTDQVDVTVNPLPIIDAGIDQTVCEGDAVTLTGAGANIYAWDNGITNGVPFVQGVGTVGYTVNGTDINGCVNTDQVNVTVNPLPIVVAGADQTVCEGIAVSLTGAGANVYAWDNGVANGVPFVQAPGVITYTVTGTDLNGCVNTDQVDVTVNANPIIDAGVDQIVCIGSMVTLNGSGATANVWDNGVMNGVAFAPSVGTLTYTVIGTDANGCVNTDQVDVTVNPLPIIDAGIDQTVCEGDAVTLTGAGANIYAWDNGITNGVPFVQGVGTVGYTVNGTDINGCVNTDQVNVTVNPLPIIDAGVDQQMCSGSAVTLNGAGAIAYAWDNGVTDGVPFGQPVGVVTYTLTGTDINGCINTDEVDVTVFALPTIEAGLDQVICLGANVTLSGTGGSVYLWDNGVNDGVAFSPAVGTITYTVIGTDANGCSNTDQVDVLVNALPVVDAGMDQQLCNGNQVTLNGSGATNYAWDNGVTDGVPFTSPNGIVTYTVIGTDNNGCQNTDQVDVWIYALPDVIAGEDLEVCAETAVTLNGTGADSFVWTGGVIDGIPFIPVVGLHTFIVSGTDVNGCVQTDTIDVIVNPNPVINAGVDQSNCDGALVVLNATGSGVISWDNGVIDGVPFVQGVSSIIYTAQSTFPTGCIATDQITVNVHANPIVTTQNDEVCQGDGVTLNGEGAVSYAWTDGVIDGVEFFPMVSHDYYVTGTDINGCSAEAVAKVIVHDLPIVDFDILDMSLTTANPTTGFDNLTTGGDTYSWDFGDGSMNSIEFEPIHTFPDDEAGEYEITLTATSIYGCQANKVKYIHVFQDYTIFVPNTFTPDGNGANEIFKPVMTGFDPQDYTMYIFNRWGDLIFETHDMEVGWDGRFAGQDFKVQDGVFTWRIQAGLKGSADSKLFVGHVSILK